MQRTSFPKEAILTAEQLATLAKSAIDKISAADSKYFAYSADFERAIADLSRDDKGVRVADLERNLNGQASKLGLNKAPSIDFTEKELQALGATIPQEASPELTRDQAVRLLQGSEDRWTLSDSPTLRVYSEDIRRGVYKEIGEHFSGDDKISVTEIEGIVNNVLFGDGAGDFKGLREGARAKLDFSREELVAAGHLPQYPSYNNAAPAAPAVPSAPVYRGGSFSATLAPETIVTLAPETPTPAAVTPPAVIPPVLPAAIPEPIDRNKAVVDTEMLTQAEVGALVQMKFGKELKDPKDMQTVNGAMAALFRGGKQKISLEDVKKQADLLIGMENVKRGFSGKPSLEANLNVTEGELYDVRKRLAGDGSAEKGAPDGKNQPAGDEQQADTVAVEKKKGMFAQLAESLKDVPVIGMILSFIAGIAEMFGGGEADKTVSNTVDTNKDGKFNKDDVAGLTAKSLDLDKDGKLTEKDSIALGAAVEGNDELRDAVRAQIGKLDGVKFKGESVAGDDGLVANAGGNAKDRSAAGQTVPE